MSYFHQLAESSCWRWWWWWRARCTHHIFYKPGGEFRHPPPHIGPSRNKPDFLSCCSARINTPPTPPPQRLLSGVPVSVCASVGVGGMKTKTEAGPGLCWTSFLLDYIKTHSRVQPGVSTGPLQLTTNSNFLLSGVCGSVDVCYTLVCLS